jgi:hypothetical protein
MEGFRSTLKPMFGREGKELNGWIHKHSQTRVQERRRGDKWMDSQALTNPEFRKDGEEING